MIASFLKSAAAPRDFPPDTGSEVAVVGRSNSGKSSAINVILGRTRLARVSKTPGRTQLINFFDVGEDRRVVDLPGYGFARVATGVRERWRELIAAYFETRESLRGLIITIDIRRGLMPLDATMIEWAQALEIPVLLLATKADKLSRAAAEAKRSELERSVPDGIGILVFSVPKKSGVEEARRQLAGWLRK